MRCIIYSASLFQVVIGRPLAGKLLPVFITVHTEAPFGELSVPFTPGPVLAWQLLDYFIMCADGMMC